MKSTLRLSLVLSALATASSLGFACGSSNSDNPGGGSSGDGGNGGGDSGAQSDGTVGTQPDGGTPNEGGNAADTGGGDGGFVQAAHLPFPVLTYDDAPLLTAPKVVTITFKGDTLAPQLDTFGAGVTSTTTWWPTVMSEYCQGDGGCVGDGPAGVFVSLDAGAPAGFNDPDMGPDDAGAAGGINIHTYLQSLMAAHVVPAPDANTIYAVYFPASINFQGAGAACNQFDGYHGQGVYSGQNYVFAVNVECAGTLSDATLTASHEFAESASDGLSTNTTGGYYINLNDPNTWGWSDEYDGEIADMCDDYYGLGQDQWKEGSFTYQRIWSVKAAAANQNPCRPVPTGEVYFNSAPATAFLEMNVGETISIEVDAFSDGPMADWAVQAQDATDPTGATSYVSLSFSGTTFDGGAGQPGVMVNNGSKPTLSITLTQDPSQAQTGVIGTGYGEADIMLWSFAGGGTNINNATAGHYWPIAVMTRADAQDAGVTTLDGAVPLARRELPASRPSPRGDLPPHAHRIPRRWGFSR